MNPFYNQSYTREEIVTILRTIQDCVRENRFVISRNENRQQNADFINEYNLTSKRQKEAERDSFRNRARGFLSYVEKYEARI